MRINRLNIPEIQTEKSKIQITSLTDAREIYTVSLIDFDCNCPDFYKNRSCFERNDIRRLCKHLIKALEEAELIFEFPGHIGLLLESAANRNKGIIIFNDYFEAETINGPILVTKASNGWYNIIAPVVSKGKNRSIFYDEFGYNLEEKRWSYGKHPPGATEIKKTIRRIENETTAQNTKSSPLDFDGLVPVDKEKAPDNNMGCTVALVLLLVVAGFLIYISS